MSVPLPSPINTTRNRDNAVSGPSTATTTSGKKSRKPKTNKSRRPAVTRQLRVCGYSPTTHEGIAAANVQARIAKVEEEMLFIIRELQSSILACGGGSENTLRMFLAPEWLWRRKNKDDKMRYWTYGQMGEIMERLKVISSMCPNVLIVAGSILWKMPGQIVEGPDGPRKANLIYNTVPVLAGGSIVHVYHKQGWGGDTRTRLSREDIFLFAPKDEVHRTDWWHKTRERQRVLMDPIFEYGGLQFGLEVCADHFCGVLKTHCEENNIGPVDVHIMISCDMQLKANSVAHHPDGGVALSCDGNGFYKNVKKRKMLCFGLYRDEPCFGWEQGSDSPMVWVLGDGERKPNKDNLRFIYTAPIEVTKIRR